MAVEGFPIPDSEMDRATTLEVAALFIISAIYFGKLDFATAPLLTDRTEARGDREARNKKEYLQRGYAAARKWTEDYQKKGIDAMRNAKKDPLSDARLSWY